jgi:MFS transporter, SP family, sugar:H+ symporter
LESPIQRESEPLTDEAQLSIGTLIGALIAAPIADKIGRRLSVSLWSVVVSIGFVIQISADRAWYQVMIGRFVAGLGVGALSLLVPMYQGKRLLGEYDIR